MPKKQMNQYFGKEPPHNYICGAGICKGKTWQEAKAIIVAKDGLDSYYQWWKRVPWWSPNYFKIRSN